MYKRIVDEYHLSVALQLPREHHPPFLFTSSSSNSSKCNCLTFHALLSNLSEGLQFTRRAIATSVDKTHTYEIYILTP